MANPGILVQSSDSILVDNWVHPQFLGATSIYSTFDNLGGAYTKVWRNPKDWDILPFPPFKGYVVLWLFVLFLSIKYVLR
jgi:hypothetical protein